MGDTYAVTIRAPIGPVSHTGTGPDISVSGTVAAAADVVITITAGGGRNAGTYKISLDGGDSYDPARTIPLDGEIAVGSTGVTVTVPESPVMVLGDVYSFSLLAPVPSISSVMSAIQQPLSMFDVEYVYVTGPSDSTDWASMGAKADEMWNIHRPTWFLAEARLPYDNEDLDDWTAALVLDRQDYAHRFVSVCTAFGEVSDSTGQRLTRNWGRSPGWAHSGHSGHARTGPGA